MSQLPVARVGVLLLAGGAGWEPDAIRGLGEAGHTVVKRCVDVADLMGSATAGQAAVAVVAGEAAGLDADAVTHLLRYDVRTVAVTAYPAEADRLGRLGVVGTATPDVPAIVGAVGAALAEELVADPVPDVADLALPEPAGSGSVVTVWGPGGAPGRTTVALGLAAVSAHAGRPTMLLDADPYGGAVAQQLGVLDEVSGLLAAARLANTGRLDPETLARCARGIADGLTVLTGLPRGERRVEVRAGVLHRLVEVAAGFGDVVLDTGFGVEDDERGGTARDQLTLDALACADEVVVVGSAEPVGLARLARALVDLADVAPGVLPHVVVNRFRPSLGWSEREVAGMVEGYLRPASLTFLPFEQATLDKAAVHGRTLVEVGDSPLRQRLSELAGQLEKSSHRPPVV